MATSQRMRIPALRQLLHQAGVDTQGMLERSELEAALRRVEAARPAQAALAVEAEADRLAADERLAQRLQLEEMAGHPMGLLAQAFGPHPALVAAGPTAPLSAMSPFGGFAPPFGGFPGFPSFELRPPPAGFRRHAVPDAMLAALFGGVASVEPEEAEAPAVAPASAAALARLERGAGGGTCAVCLETCEEDAADAARLPCGHEFHKTCVTEWLQRSGACPVCRQEL